MDPAIQFLIEGDNMAFATELAVDGKDIPQGLFLDIMIKKTQMLHNHLKHLDLRLALVANIGGNMATIKLYDTFVEDSLKLHFTISNLWDIEDQLYRLWIEVNGVVSGVILVIKMLKPLYKEYYIVLYSMYIHNHPSLIAINM